MAYFKLSLLTPNFNTTIDNKYVCQTISEFQSQIDRFNTNETFVKKSNTYTFDENFAIHKNVDKELSFSILQKQFNDNFEWVENPFVSTLQIGSLLLLTDKYLKTYLLVVKNINYKFLEHNIEYKYTCQDFFSYQLSRQANGYSIANDPSKSDFIGSKPIDWWIENKIDLECNIYYEYVQTNKGLCIYEEYINNKLVKNISTYNSEDELLTDKWKDRRVISILKHCDISENASENFILSLSGSNAKAALITAADQIGYMVNAYEFWDETASCLLNFYWVEPVKNTNYSGLTYSPFNNVQDFSLSLNGDSLTTVLNVESVTSNEEEVTLIPELSPFFTKVIGSSEWEKSVYEDGYFSNLSNGDIQQYQQYLSDDSSILNIVETTCLEDILLNENSDVDISKQPKELYSKVDFINDKYCYTTYQLESPELEDITIGSTVSLSIPKDTPLNTNNFTFIPVPSDYSVREFVESTGNEYFKTGVPFIGIENQEEKQEIAFQHELTFQIPEETINEYKDKTSVDLYFFGIDNMGSFSTVFGPYWLEGESPQMRYIFNDNVVFRTDTFNSRKYKLIFRPLTDNKNVEVILEKFNETGDQIVQSDVLIKSFRWDYDKYISQEVYLFFSHILNSSSTAKTAPIRIYEYKVFDVRSEGSMQCHWIPCTTKNAETEEVGMYDLHNQKFAKCYTIDSNQETNIKCGSELYTTTDNNIYQSMLIEYATLNDDGTLSSQEPIKITEPGYLSLSGDIYITYNNDAKKLLLNNYNNYTINNKKIIKQYIQTQIPIYSKYEITYDNYTNTPNKIECKELKIDNGLAIGEGNPATVFSHTLIPYNVKPYYDIISFDKSFVSEMSFKTGEIRYCNSEKLSYWVPINYYENTKFKDNILLYVGDGDEISIDGYEISTDGDEIPINSEKTSINELYKTINTKTKINHITIYKNKEIIHYYKPFYNSTIQGLHDIITGDYIYATIDNAGNEPIIEIDEKNYIIGFTITEGNIQSSILKKSNGLYYISQTDSSKEFLIGVLKFPIEHEKELSIEAKANEGYLVITSEFRTNDPTADYGVDNININITQYSNITEEDELFTKIADQCPWLENVLIDFNYFLEQKIIDNIEHQNLMNLFRNKLRIINGKLLFYSKEYFNALRQKTKIIADLLSKFDNLGAWVKTNIIDAYSTNGTIEQRNDFKSIYDQTFYLIKTNSQNKNMLINLDDTVSEYLNKYFNSEQRFLKNIYNFKNYFNQLNQYSNSIRYNYNLSSQILSSYERNNNYYNIVLNNGTWEKLWKDNGDLINNNINTSNITVAIKNGNNYEKIDIVNTRNYIDYFVADAPIYSNNITKFSDRQKYFYKENEQYIETTRDEMFQKYLNSLLNSNDKKDKYYYRTSDYHDFNTVFAPPNTLFSNLFFAGNRVNYNIHNKLFSPSYNLLKDKGRQNVARCYITNIPVSELYCKVEEKDNKGNLKWSYKPLNYVGNTWDGSIDSTIFTSRTKLAQSLLKTTPVGIAYSHIKKMFDEASNSVEINTFYRRTDSKPDDNQKQNQESDEDDENVNNDNETETNLVRKFDTSGHPTCYLDGKLIRRDWKWELRYESGLCNYWNLNNIAEKYNTEDNKYSYGNYEDCVAALFTTTNEWDENFNFNDYRKTNDNGEIIPYDSDEKPMQLEDYNNYFSKIVATYNYKGCRKYIKNKYWRFLKPGETLKPGMTYYKMCWDEICSLLWSFVPPLALRKTRISALQFYFLKEYFEAITVSKNTLVSQYFKNRGPAYVWNHEVDQWPIFYKYDGKRYSIFIEEDFDVHVLSDDNRNNINSYTILYNTETHEPLDWTTDIKFLQDNYYYMEPTTFSKATEDYDNGIQYYYQDDEDNFKPAYHWTDLSSMNKDQKKNYYYFTNEHVTQSSWKQLDELTLYPILQHIYIDNNGKISVKQIDSPEPLIINLASLQDKYVINFESKTYTLNNLEVDATTEAPFKTMTNGEFWYHNHQKVEDPVLFQEAAVIETQLSEYWTVAYGASLNCEYVIPENWQTTTNGTINYFKNLLYTIENDSIKLNPLLIPDVQLVNSGIKLLPKYQFHYSSKNIATDKTNIAIDTVQTNVAIQNMIDYINNNKELLSKDHLYLTETGVNTTYYYVDKNRPTGMQWQNFPNYILKTSPIYEELSGNYIMLLRYLLTCYQQRETLTYEELKKEQKAIWYMLIKQYPNIILQNSYTPTNATTCEDVLYMATNALKDFSSAERQYNITLLENKISNFKLNNYKQQELHLGDPIAIKANDYYHQYDSIYNILQSYLFISDISYKLREDSSLKLTVNNLKYQDKLIQSLVSLIR